MTKDEFKEWFRHFRGLFPTIVAWLGKFPRDESPDTSPQPTQKEILSGWYAALERVELDDARRATSRLAAGDEEMPASFDRVAARIRQLAQHLSRERRFCERRADDPRDPTYRCWRCNDTGSVPVIHPRSLKQVLRIWPEGPPDRFQYADVCQPAGVPIVYTAGLDCTCAVGRVRPGPHYNEREHCHFTGAAQPHQAGSYQKVREWVVNRNAFSEWNPDDVGEV